MTINIDSSDLFKWLSDRDEPLIIAGPCSAETEDQVFATARQLKELGRVNMYRAGSWKPRTRPNSFEGNGTEALAWLARVEKEIGLPTITEVANASHVEEVLKHGLSAVWIGARTTVNPFSVQEIADALRGEDVTVLVKNPINPDIGLWIGALERIGQAGIKNLGAIHRGFAGYDPKFRNTPNWEIPIELKTIAPELPLICDPSHISGNRENIFSVSQKALDLDFDGLMIETHISPDDAWSDAKQQVTPAALKSILEGLVLREKVIRVADTNIKIEELRSRIDEVDTIVLARLAERMKLVEEIAKFKKDNNSTILQVDRWKEILDSRIPFGESKGLNVAFLDKLLQLIHDESIRSQSEFYKDED